MVELNNSRDSRQRSIHFRFPEVYLNCWSLTVLLRQIDHAHLATLVNNLIDLIGELDPLFRCIRTCIYTFIGGVVVLDIRSVT